MSVECCTFDTSNLLPGELIRVNGLPKNYVFGRNPDGTGLLIIDKRTWILRKINPIKAKTINPEWRPSLAHWIQQ